MRDVMIKTGVYGRRDEKGRVLPAAKGERVSLPDEEAARLVALDVAAYADALAQAPDTPPGGEEEPEVPEDTTGAAPATEATTGGEEGDSANGAPTEAQRSGLCSDEVARLERMLKDDLEQMAQDLGVDISGAKNKHDIAVLIAAAESDETYDPSEPEDEDIVR